MLIFFADEVPKETVKNEIKSSPGPKTRSKDAKIVIDDAGKASDPPKTKTLDIGTEENGDLSIFQEVAASDFLQRKVQCSLCVKRFWSLQDLRRHMRSHTGKLF